MTEKKNQSDYDRDTTTTDNSVVTPNINTNENNISGATITVNEIDYRERKLPLIGGLPISQQYTLLFTSLVAGFGSLGYSLYQEREISVDKNAASSAALKLGSDLQLFEASFADAVVGKSAAFNLMLVHRDNAVKTRLEFEKIAKDSGSEKMKNFVEDLNMRLDKVRKNIEQVNNEKNLINDMESRVVDLKKLIIDMQKNLDIIQANYIKGGMSSKELENFLLIKNSLSFVAENFEKMLLRADTTKEQANALGQARKDVGAAIEKLYYGDSGIRAVDLNNNEAYNSFVGNWVKTAEEVDTYVNYVDNLMEIKNMIVDNTTTLGALYPEFQEIAQDIGTHQSEKAALTAFWAGLALVLASFLSMVFVYANEQRKRAYKEQQEAARQSRAVMNLLTEMLPLKDGILKKINHKTEDVTSAIASSVNDTVTSLAGLVKQIQDSSLTMREKTNEASTVAFDMLEKNEFQASSIEETGTEVLKVNSAISEISKRALVTSKQAAESAKVAEEGADQVNSAIGSMRSINDNMVETSVLMKKVSESSKQISEILSLLSDITEQTNILALNATIQAARAGDAGKGFSIVAESIQGLADSANDATRKVGALIGTVQTDIQSVAQAIEKTTEQVKSGVELSEKAGASLEEMIMQSQTLAEIIEGVSQDSQYYAEMAQQISNNMQVILKATEENKESTQTAVNSITEIAEISQGLGESVQKFKLEL